MVADHRDPNPIGSDRYRTTLSLLKIIGAEAFDRVLASPDWAFIPDQWQVQMWAKVFRRIAMRDFVYFAPQLGDKDWRDLPGLDGRSFLPADRYAAPDAHDTASIIEAAMAAFLAKRGFTAEDVAAGRCRVAYLADGPYGIPFLAKADT